MSRWIPPIPKAAMYRPAAIALGEALPLLFYCYDVVDRAGWVDLRLAEAADALDTPYPTIKRWWQRIHASGMFCEVHSRGRAGIRAHFAADWLDWSMPNGYQRPDDGTGSEVIPKGAAPTQNGTETGSEVISIEPAPTQNGSQSGSEVIPIVMDDAENGIRNGTETGSPPIPFFLHVGTHDSRSSSGGMCSWDSPAPPNQQPPPLAAHNPETNQPSTPTHGERHANGTPPQPPPPVPPAPSPPGPAPAQSAAYTALWASLDEPSRAWLKQVAMTPSERQRLDRAIADYGDEWVRLGVVAAHDQGGRTLKYLERLLTGCRADGRPPGTPKGAASAKKVPPPLGETEEQFNARIRRELAEKYANHSYHRSP
jgi:hypothetical protein